MSLLRTVRVLTSILSMMKATVALLMAASTASAFHNIPKRAQNGRMFEMVGGREAFTVGAAKTYDQLQDHSDPNKGTYEQRYYEDLSVYNETYGPLFVYIGGEGPLGGTPSGYVMNIAKALGAAVISVEHRFYGQSIPNGNLETDNLKLLTVEQALNDAATFTQWWRSEHGFTASQPTLAIGGSYPGALAAWIRVDHSDVFDASWSSSGVVEAKESFPEFDEHVAKALQRDVGAACLPTVRATMRAFEAAIDAGGEEENAAKALFHAEALVDKRDFYYMLADSASMAVQYGTKEGMCEALSEHGASAPENLLREQFANFTKAHYGENFGKDCFYDTQCLNSDEARWQPTARSWRWQKCYELAYFQVAPAQGSIRPASVDLNYHHEQCSDVFGIENMRPTVDDINSHYGGAHPKTDRVFASGGGDDPWLEVSVQKTLGPEYPEDTAWCNGCGHCKDLHSPSDGDSAATQKQRQLEATRIMEWMRA